MTTVRAAHERAAPWPYGRLDLDRLRLGGWRPVPPRDIVVKVHQRCDLACDYCYVYTQSDRSWRQKPTTMPDGIRRELVVRLGRHVRRHELDRIRVVLHGGEPLLFGPARLGALASEIRAELPHGCAAEIGIQTNGVRLDAAALAVFRENGIKVGVSVDGIAADHDRHRRTRSGKGTFAAVAAALELLARPENRPCYAGVLCTVAPHTDPIATYEQLVAFDPPTLDLLLPHATWEHPPERTSPASYGHWLAEVFDRWYATPSPVSIRLFDDIVCLLLGGSSRSEQVGLTPSGVVVVETDGTIEQVDALKVTYPGACATGLDITRHDIDAVLTDPGIVARQIGLDALPAECRGCPVRQVCGGGHYAHRYRPHEGFHNRSVYCEDLRYLIDHVHDRVSADVKRLSMAGVP